MKVERAKPERFEPITITIESEEELRALVTALNFTPPRSSWHWGEFDDEVAFNLWKAVDGFAAPLLNE